MKVTEKCLCCTKIRRQLEIDEVIRVGETLNIVIP